MLNGQMYLPLDAFCEGLGVFIILGVFIERANTQACKAPVGAGAGLTLNTAHSTQHSRHALGSPPLGRMQNGQMVLHTNMFCEAPQCFD
jgi:hypothetical protein